jgi:8-oxo-dGTP pyrophosphatase MutT (NUDIX family)
MKIRGRGISPGRVTGEALAIDAPFSFVGGADPTTGAILDPSSGVEGQRLVGRIFAFPRGKGSTVVDRVDTGGIRTGDRIILDGDRGTLELPDVKAVPVVSVVLRNRGRILIVRRSDSVGTFRGRWSAISGYLEGREPPRSRAVREVREETGLRRIVFRAAAPPIFARADATVFVVHPFLFEAPSRKVRLDWENVEHRWIRPEELDQFESVPRLKDVVQAVIGPKAVGTRTSTRAGKRAPG